MKTRYEYIITKKIEEESAKIFYESAAVKVNSNIAAGGIL